MGRKPQTATTYQTKVSDRLSTMEVDESFKRNDFIKEVWGDCDVFICRSFDVLFVHAKKLFPEKKFKTIKGFIHRIK